jgi:hypothetical protein
MAMNSAVDNKTTALRRTIAGLGYLEGYGHHPGWPSFIGLVVVGCAISLWVGAANAVVFGSILCIGAYERAKESGL